tara:strand:+ start:3614 stop:4168 length:555 start_codon:yes stop_codon:yes gene_type:complete
MKKILIIGAGGIGSYLIPLLQRTGLYEITAYDPDKVEKKNLTYQNFKDGDESEHKVSVMKRRFKIQTTQPFPILTASQLEGYDLVVCCADNLDVRRLLYRDGKQWLDLRAQGRNCAYISFRSNPEMYDTLLSGPKGSFSCQGDEWDGKAEGIHFSHIIAAGMGAEWIQRFFAKDDIADFKVVNV